VNALVEAIEDPDRQQVARALGGNVVLFWGMAVVDG
jgi:hypothetical protein